MNREKKTILIAGGAGFIGSYLCEKYLEKEQRVICVDNLQTTGTTRNIDHLSARPDFLFWERDVVNPLRIREKIDWIFNFACAGSYTSYQFDPIHTLKTNVVGMLNLLELAERNGARIMQASTSEVYGDALAQPQPESYWGNVNAIGPRACYDEGKRCAETLCMDYHRERGVDIRIIRIFNTYGPRMDLHDGRAVSNFISSALAGTDLVIYGDGSQTRSFQYIDDLIAGIDRMMAQEGFLGPVNLGNPREISIADLARMVVARAKSSSSIVFAAAATDDPQRRCPDIALARARLGWEPNVALEDGVARTIAAFRSVELPDRKVLVFATTYEPDLGPAEQAFHALTREMPDTQFHIIAARLRRNLPARERIGNCSIWRIGLGTRGDKYLLPLGGLWRAAALVHEHHYRFMWSIMASYGGIAAWLVKLIRPRTIFFLTLDDNEFRKNNSITARIRRVLAQLMIRRADAVYVGDGFAAQDPASIPSQAHFERREASSMRFMNQIRAKYAQLLSRQQRKLTRPK